MHFTDSYRYLEPEEISRLELQGCVADDWSGLMVVQDFQASSVRRCRFTGKNYLGV